MRSFWNYFFTIILLFTVTDYCLAKVYERGYIINNQGDSLSGQIMKTRNIDLSFEIIFKPRMDSDYTVIYTPDSIREFCFIDDQIIYNSVQYWYYINDEKRYAKRFAKQIYCDKFTLYKLDIPKEETYYEFEAYKLYAYVLKLDTAFYTLSQREKIIIKESDVPTTFNESSAILPVQQFKPIKTYSTLKKEYVYILRYLLRDCSKGLQNVDHLDFQDKAFVSFFKKYGNCFIKY